MGSDIEKALALYERPDIRDCILDFTNEEHAQAAQQVIAAFPEAARRALAADERVKEIVRLGCMCRDRQQLVKARDRLAVLLGDRDYIGAREDWGQAKNGGDREC